MPAIPCAGKEHEATATHNPQRMLHDAWAVSAPYPRPMPLTVRRVKAHHVD